MTLRPGTTSLPAVAGHWPSHMAVLLGAAAALAGCGPPRPPATAQFLQPRTGTEVTRANPRFSWTAVPDAEAYYLYVGTSPGAHDVVDSGEIQTTSLQAARLPAGSPLFARIWTRRNGQWLADDIEFTVRPRAAVFVYPPDNQGFVDIRKPFSWTPVDGNPSYVLTIGTTPGGRDLLVTGPLKGTSYQVQRLPSRQMAYARIQTRTGWMTYHHDVVFETPDRAWLVSPASGSLDVSPTTSFAWTTVSDADRYSLAIGTAPGQADVFETTVDPGASSAAAILPPGRTLFASLATEVRGRSLLSDLVFRTGQALPPLQLLYPSPGSSAVDLRKPFEWTPTALADGYRLEIGRGAGSWELHDSGVIRTSRHFAPPLPAGQSLVGRLSRLRDDRWTSMEFRFSVAETGEASRTWIDTALWLTASVRAMAGPKNRVFPWTPFWPLVLEAGRSHATCDQYAALLVNLLRDANVELPSRLVYVSFNSNLYDRHTLVELQLPSGEGWMLLDPTFGLAAHRTADGGWASADDISSAARSEDWNAIQWRFLTPSQAGYARNYYLDYPLLFLNVSRESARVRPGTEFSPLAYFDELGSLPVGTPGRYALRCVGATEVRIAIDGQPQTLPCDGVDQLTHVFSADSIEALDVATARARVLGPRRYVF